MKTDVLAAFGSDWSRLFWAAEIRDPIDVSAVPTLLVYISYPRTCCILHANQTCVTTRMRLSEQHRDTAPGINYPDKTAMLRKQCFLFLSTQYLQHMVPCLHYPPGKCLSLLMHLLMVSCVNTLESADHVPRRRDKQQSKTGCPVQFGSVAHGWPCYFLPRSAKQQEKHTSREFCQKDPAMSQDQDLPEIHQGP